MSKKQSKHYDAAWAQIGNASGFRLSARFFKENPQFTGAKGAVEVIGPDTLLVRLQTQSSEEAEDELILSLFLDFLMKNALANPDSELEAYTSAMSSEDDELLAGVVVDS
jgi:antitoxin PrlF